MPSPAHDSERTLGEAGATLARQRAVRGPAIGRGSAALRRRHLAGKLKRIVLAVLAIVIAAIAAGLVLGGIGFEGLFISVLAIAAVTVALARYPRMNAPTRADLRTDDIGTLVARAELWLEAQRPALPVPAARMLDGIGVRLDALGTQLEGIEAAHPAARDVRSLVGEHLPAMIESYRRIPANIRGEERAGRTPDQQLTEGLRKIDGELEEVTRQLAAGDLDSLAIRGRYLDYRSGGELLQGDEV